MANSQSLVLLPPQPAAAPKSQQSIQKPSKPAPDNSFGQKLDKAKKHIDSKSSDAKSTAAPTKPAGTPSDKAPADPPNPAAAATDQPIDPTTQKPVVKVPKPAGKDPADSEGSVAEDPTKPAIKTAEPTPVKAAAPIKGTADKPKKTDKPVEQKTDSSKGAITAPPVAVKVAADQSAYTQHNLPVDAGSAARPANAPDTNTTSSSASTTTSAGNQLFGSGKVVGKGNPGDVNSTTENAAVSDQSAASNAAAQVDPVAMAATQIAATADAPAVKATPDAGAHTPGITPDVTGLSTPITGGSPAAIAAKSAGTHAVSPQLQFAEDNHPKIVTSIVGQLMPRGGTMQLQLNPADLGALQVTVHMQDGVMTASFETSNDDATRVLSHSLGQLKAGLEAAGVSVEKLHVEQAPQRDTKNDSDSGDSKQPMQEHQKQAQQDQQRREMVQRMWRRLAGGSDPLDLVA